MLNQPVRDRIALADIDFLLLLIAHGVAQKQIDAGLSKLPPLPDSGETGSRVNNGAARPAGLFHDADTIGSAVRQ